MSLAAGDSPCHGTPGELAVKLGRVVRRCQDGSLPAVVQLDSEPTPTAFRHDHKPGDPLWICRYRIDEGPWIDGKPSAELMQLRNKVLFSSFFYSFTAAPGCTR